MALQHDTAQSQHSPQFQAAVYPQALAVVQISLEAANTAKIEPDLVQTDKTHDRQVTHLLLSFFAIVAVKLQRMDRHPEIPALQVQTIHCQGDVA